MTKERHPLNATRREYTLGALNEEELPEAPFPLFKEWFDLAMASQAFEPNACALATAGDDGIPTCRIVLLKGIDERGYTFFTNYQSRKGENLSQNPRATLLFYWPGLERQVRVEGNVERTTSKESDDYFADRPLEAQIGASASKQSRPLASRNELENAVQSLRECAAEGKLTRPEWWGGYRLIPHRVEFWQGREGRLHDRVSYQQVGNAWKKERLWP